jgi:hypothetical protein
MSNDQCPSPEYRVPNTQYRTPNTERKAASARGLAAFLKLGRFVRGCVYSSTPKWSSGVSDRVKAT